MGSHRRLAPSGCDRSTRATVLGAAAATAAAALTATPATAEPHDTRAGTRAQVDRLFEQAEKATEAFNKADERADKLREQVGHVKDAVAKSQERINTMRGAIGALAGAQYRSGGVDPSLALLLSSDPDSFLDRAAALGRVNNHHASELSGLIKAQRGLSQDRAEATRMLAELDKSRTEVARHKRSVEHRLSAARRLLNSLPEKERDDHGRSSRSDEAGRHDLAGSAAPSGRASSALAAARQAIGSPYVWGANGPSRFDCSGLTQWAWSRAGVSLPRTSQAQASAGHSVPLSQARPGDLVAYRDDASHIGMYAGGGQVIHAPYPGAQVRYDPVGMMPISSITRP
ncbi:C40 family peptidase [Streptomyces tsukubensis]|uniref:NlpC/P60 domain-containing protein n=1 Tax=Streptomyces tsukubensis TaxID=83656 RepID=A0A1V4A7B7_9ACTN|nr:C40 family peptidase [Streptomyces tsukubensis]OON77670.1 hypothetical protein B1H18_18240 [Streptomyces tsukubensis]QFR93177.1 hypothetical protein GBW32_08875 [Streptomyces tsukubensis]